MVSHRKRTLAAFAVAGVAAGVAVWWVASARDAAVTDAAPAGTDGPVLLAVADGGEFPVEAHWGPVTDSMSNFHRTWDELRDLRPAAATTTYRGSDFRAFLPDGPVAVGDTWSLKADGLLPFLRQFHPGATLDLHINNGDSPGAHACLRAVGGRYAEIAFRVHAEFVLREGFFTPGQFAGTLVLDRSDGRVAYFRLHLPPGPINYDVGRRIPRGGGTMLVNGREVEVESFHATDAGSISRMELAGGNPAVTEGVRWAASRSVDEVAGELAGKFYKFKRIEWVAFESALARSREAGRPLHVVAVNGTLDDESC